MPARAEEQKKQERRDSYYILQREYYIRGTAIQERAYVGENGLNTTNFVVSVYYRSAAPVRRLRARCRQLTAPGAGAWATAQLRCAFALGVGSSLHLALVLRLRHSYGAPSRLVSAAHCTWRWCMGYGAATVCLRAWCRQLTAPGAGAWATAQLRCAFALVVELGVGSLLHMALVLGLRHSYGALSR